MHTRKPTQIDNPAPGSAKLCPGGIPFIALALLLATAAVASEGEEHDLIGNMGSLQKFSHKFDLAIRHENRALADFYAHELEETIEATTAIEAYHDKPVGKLTENMLVPAFDRLEQALDDEAADWDAIGGAFDAFIVTCNSCHAATDYGIIRIERTGANPFMQSFDKHQD